MFFLFFVAESPNRQQLSLWRLCLFAFLPIVLIIVIFLILFVLSYHPLHDLHASLEWCRIPSSWLVWLLFFLLISTFLVVFVLLFELLDVGVPYLPLSNFSSEVVGNWRASRCSNLLYWRVNGLNLSALIVELVSHCLFNGLNILSRARFFLLRLPFDLLEFGLATVLDFFLNLILIGGGMDIISFQAKMHNKLINCFVFLVFAFQIVIHDSVGFSLRVGDNQCLGDGFTQFGCRQSGIIGDFLDVTINTWASSSSSSLTMLTSLAWMTSCFLEPFFWMKVVVRCWGCFGRWPPSSIRLAWWVAWFKSI